MKLEPSRFASGVRASRYDKKNVVVEADGSGMIKPLVFGKKPFHKNQILVETDEYYIVSPVVLEHRAVGDVLSVCLDPGWNIVTEMLTGRNRTKGEDSGKLLRPGFGHEVIYRADIDRAINVLQDMGRWDVAFRLVLDLLDMDTCPATAVLWEKFPHKSKMLLLTSPTTGIYLGGAMKDVVEKWWAYCGGYHNKKGQVYIMPRDEYDEFMKGVRNPFVLAGVDREASRIVLRSNFHPVAFQPEDITAAHVSGRKYWVFDRVIYLADVDGYVLPYWYTNMDNTAETPERVGWDRDMTKKLAAHMNLPLLVQRKVEAS